MYGGAGAWWDIRGAMGKIKSAVKENTTYKVEFTQLFNKPMGCVQKSRCERGCKYFLPTKIYSPRSVGLYSIIASGGAWDVPGTCLGLEFTTEGFCWHPMTLVISVEWRAYVPGNKEICQQWIRSKAYNCIQPRGVITNTLSHHIVFQQCHLLR